MSLSPAFPAVKLCALVAASLILLGACGGGKPGDPDLSQETPSVESSAPVVEALDYRSVTIELKGTIEGVVRLAQPMTPPAIEVSKDVDTCGQSLIDESSRLGPDNELANVVVWLEGISSGKAFTHRTDTPVMAIEGCTASPRVRLVTLGEALYLENRDTVLHDVLASDLEGKTPSRYPLPVQGLRARVVFGQSGVHMLQCQDGHVWMRGFVVVAAHPYYAVTDERGWFVLEDVPAGSYRLVLWHELAGRHEVEARVEPGATERLEWTLRLSGSSDPS